LHLIKRAEEITNSFDEAMIAEEITAVFTVDGDVRNFKITVPQDLKFAENSL
jgi:2-C-methyl-D-erythritol 4-phosphate cytidylyltransferase